MLIFLCIMSVVNPIIIVWAAVLKEQVIQDSINKAMKQAQSSIIDSVYSAIKYKGER